ncbi:MAG: hypothetical protein JKX68_07185 [Flavobacteriales bacterium]|nr:hypothetical protein [Flavobacteriales bacterium]
MQYLKYSLLVLIVIPLMAFSQYKPGKAGGGLYNTGQNNVDKGWFFGVGLTYMWAYNNVKEEITVDSLNTTYTNKYIGDPKGKFGLFAEVGLFKMTDRKFINYRDFGLSWKWFRGGEDYTDEFYVNDVLTNTRTEEGSFGDHLISGNFNLGHRFDASDNLFYVNGLGLNADYHIIKGRTPTPAIPNNVDYVNGPSAFLGELHYFFGIGFKTGKRLIIMPIIETPILALYPFNHIVSTHPYFNTRFRPFLIRVRFMFLKKGSKSCPAVYNPMGIDPNGNGPK